jgi:hypothetical protein
MDTIYKKYVSLSSEQVIDRCVNALKNDPERLRRFLDDVLDATAGCLDIPERYDLIRTIFCTELDRSLEE